MPACEVDLFGVFGVVLEHRLQLLRRRASQHDGIHLVVEQHAPPVEIRGTDHRPYTIDDRGLGMKHDILGFIDFHPGFQQVGIVRTANRKRSLRIAVARQQQADIDAAPRGSHEIFFLLIGRHEIGGAHPDTLLGVADR